MADWLFDVNVFARLDRPDGCQRMPVIWGRDTDDINTLVFKTLSHVGVKRWSLAGLLFDFVSSVVDHRFIDVNECGDLTIFPFTKSGNV